MTDMVYLLMKDTTDYYHSEEVVGVFASRSAVMVYAAEHDIEIKDEQEEREHHIQSWEVVGIPHDHFDVSTLLIPSAISVPDWKVENAAGVRALQFLSRVQYLEPETEA